MTLRSKSLRLACLLVVIGWAGSAQAVYYSIAGATSGGQAQIGDGLPLPIQKATSTMGGPLSMGGAIGTGMNFPPLLIVPNPTMTLLSQTTGPDPKAMKIPPGVFKTAPAVPTTIGVQLNNPAVFQVKTKIVYTAPGPFGSPVLKAGGRTGLPTTTFIGVPATANVKYTKTTAQFGGVNQAKVAAASPIVVWLVAAAMAPCKSTAFAGPDAGCIAIKAAAFPGSKAVNGGPMGVTAMTPGGPPPAPGWFFASAPLATGKIAMSAPTGGLGPGMGGPGLTNMATSFGGPWTTGMISLSQPSAKGAPEVFVLTGKDTRVGGVGTIQFVTGALSTRTLSGPNANRGWGSYTLPEPAAVLGAVAALAMLGVCHGLARRRSR